MYSDLEEREFNLSKLRRVKLKGTRGTNNYLQGKINKWNGSLEKRLATTGKITQKDVERGALVGDLMAGNVKVPKKSTIGQMENFISRHSKL